MYTLCYYTLLLINAAKCCLPREDDAPLVDAPKQPTKEATETPAGDASPAPPPATPSLPSDPATDPPAADTPGSHPLKRQVEFDPQVEQQTFVADTQAQPTRSAPSVSATAADAGTV